MSQTFEEAFKKLVKREGFKLSKTLIDKRKHTFAQLYQSPKGARYNLVDAVVAIVHGG